MDFKSFFIFLMMAGSTCMQAVGADFVLDQGAAGNKVIGLAIQDSLEEFNYNDISIEGYEIENAVLIQNNDPSLGYILKPGVIDISRSALVITKQFQPQTGEIEIEAPLDWVFAAGAIVVDTAFSGFSRRILEVVEAGSFGDRKIWQLKTEPVSLLDIVEQCDISFSSQSDLTFEIPDTTWVERLAGQRELDLITGATWAESQVEFHLKRFEVHVKPRISGRLRVVGGVIEINEFIISGVHEINAELAALASSPGLFNFTKSFPRQISHTIPVDSGIVLNLTQGISLTANITSKGENFRSHSEIKAIQDFHSNLKYAGGWNIVHNEMNTTPLGAPASGDVSELFSSGQLIFQVSPNAKLLWNAENGLDFSVHSFSRATQDSSLYSSFNRTYSTGISGEALALGKFQTQVSPMPGTLKFGELEKILSRPPIQPLEIKPPLATSHSLNFEWIHDEAANYYLVEKLENGLWVMADTVSSPPLQITELEPLQDYKYRLIPINAMGAGVPFEFGGKTLRFNLPPSPPQFKFPVDGDTLGALNLNFAWSVEDPDSPPEELRYSLLLDTNPQPITIHFNYGAEKEFHVASVQPGHKYYWRVQVADGPHRILSPIWSFYVPKAKSPVENPEPKYPASVFIEGGTFKRSDGKTVEVRGFYLQKFEVRQKDFKSVMNFNPSYWKGDNLPVESLNWNQADSYCKEIGGRLPTESEWEYASRGGSPTQFYWKNENTRDYAWYFENSGKKTHPVGSKKPNDYGLFDMSGNVFEWVADWYGDYLSGKLINPVGAQQGTAKVTRGGSWYSDLESLRSDMRFKNRPGFSSYKLGFRCAYSAEK